MSQKEIRLCDRCGLEVTSPKWFGDYCKEHEIELLDEMDKDFENA